VNYIEDAQESYIAKKKQKNAARKKVTFFERRHLYLK
jgi:hypothetical protein